MWRPRIKLLLLLLVLAAPVPVAWAMWHWQWMVPDGVGVEALVQPQIAPLTQWLPEFGDEHQADFYLLLNCQQQCPAERIWRIHRALGRDAERVWRWRVGETLSQSGLPGESLKAVPAPFKAPLALADHQGRIVLLFQHLDDRQILRDVRYVLKRVPAKPDYWLEDQDD
ncbi:hypothetical protein GCM10011297_05530 [Bacterioplanes sanyensis]|uniref:hypothetical protein n=1 Tax=Bacterioplanes sanyensis TaxID=1249553 RepID=UPI001676A03B|nr:hypothetical protein [Bacterioplanes sanyensis]GGY35323.1 hypothetical protein GCM10011297_05530 [Bacterioplanes sanyensis]